MAVERYPLAWPVGWRRTPTLARVRAKFGKGERVYSNYTRPDGSRASYLAKRDLSVYDAIKRLQAELDRLNASYVTLSTNVELRLDGWPRSDRRAPADPGVAVYFTLRGKERCLACDAFDTVAGNIAALAAHIEALRAIDRYKVGSVDQAFAGYVATLPSAAHEWRQVFGFDSTWQGPIAISMVEERFRMMAREAHPDAGGSHEQMVRLTTALAAARKELGG